MSAAQTPPTRIAAGLPNGSGAAAVLAAGVGSLAVALIAIAADQIASVKMAMAFYRPSGPLSGVTTTAVIVWLVVWAILEIRWRKKDVRIGRIAAVALVLVALSVLLTFPPIADLF